MNNLTRWESYRPVSIGFEDMFKRLDVLADNPQLNYPPYNLVKLDEECQQLQLALAGFDKDDIEVALERRVLNINVQKKMPEVPNYVHKGISSRTFSRNWELSEETVIDEITYINGLLCVTLRREVPEDLKRKVLTIS